MEYVGLQCRPKFVEDYLCCTWFTALAGWTDRLATLIAAYRARQKSKPLEKFDISRIVVIFRHLHC